MEEKKIRVVLDTCVKEFVISECSTLEQAKAQIMRAYNVEDIQLFHDETLLADSSMYSKILAELETVNIKAIVGIAEKQTNQPEAEPEQNTGASDTDAHAEFRTLPCKEETAKSGPVEEAHSLKADADASSVELQACLDENILSATKEEPSAPTTGLEDETQKTPSDGPIVSIIEELVGEFKAPEQSSLAEQESLKEKSPDMLEKENDRSTLKLGKTESVGEEKEILEERSKFAPAQKLEENLEPPQKAAAENILGANAQEELAQERLSEKIVANEADAEKKPDDSDPEESGRVRVKILSTNQICSVSKKNLLKLNGKTYYIRKKKPSAISRILKAALSRVSSIFAYAIVYIFFSVYMSRIFMAFLVCVAVLYAVEKINLHVRFRKNQRIKNALKQIACFVCSLWLNPGYNMRMHEIE
ncbi:uncharacterized protein NEMAJ01_1799 [Nematocida major]|uniref:uncharacterized protein n=1 Tax=Nematocida major TaxID=1912982 RepID=UPI0020085C6B|nr:uncharacterized protein NEMAJ01_1799 [Nematocida major]KAH9386903.1 hypothetical protein NEMAJ01_1799 [Nematocida major]